MIASKCKEHNQIGCWCQSDNIFTKKIKVNSREVTLTEEEIKKFPNDMELGKAIRAFILNLEASRKEAEKQNKPKNFCHKMLKITRILLISLGLQFSLCLELQSSLFNTKSYTKR